MTMVPQFGRGSKFDPGFAMTEEQERELRISILMGQGLTRAEAEAEIDGLYRYPPPGHRPDLIQPIGHIEDEEEPPLSPPRDLPRIGDDVTLGPVKKDLPRTKGKDLDGAGAPNETQGTYLQDLATIPVPGQPRANTPLRMLEVLGSIGGEFLGGRSQNKAIKEAAASQASANLINALRPGAGARGTPAVAEQTFLETLAKGVGKGAGAIRSAREFGDAGEVAKYNRQIARLKERETNRQWKEDFRLKEATEERRRLEAETAEQLRLTAAREKKESEQNKAPTMKEFDGILYQWDPNALGPNKGDWFIFASEEPNSEEDMIKTANSLGRIAGPVNEGSPEEFLAEISKNSASRAFMKYYRDADEFKKLRLLNAMIVGRNSREKGNTSAGRTDALETLLTRRQFDLLREAREQAGVTGIFRRTVALLVGPNSDTWLGGVFSRAFPASATVEAMSEVFAIKLAKIINGGKPATPDQEAARALVPNLFDSDEAARMKFAVIEHIFKLRSAAIAAGNLTTYDPKHDVVLDPANIRAEVERNFTKNPEWLEKLKTAKDGETTNAARFEEDKDRYIFHDSEQEDKQPTAEELEALDAEDPRVGESIEQNVDSTSSKKKMNNRFQAASPDTILSVLGRVSRPGEGIQDAGDDFADVADVADVVPPQASAFLQEPVFLDRPAKGKTPDLEKVSTSDAGQRMVALTQKTLGDFRSPEGEVIVTVDSLKAAESPSFGATGPYGSSALAPQFTSHTSLLPRQEIATMETGRASQRPAAFQSPYRIEIDPNINRAVIYDSAGSIVEELPVGTGDITGTRYDRKYFSPIGSFKVESEVSYERTQGSYGPWWMGISAPKAPSGQGYGLHGPHATKDVDPEGGFVNQGYVSHGCLRFTVDDMNTVSKYLDIGSKVDILPYATVKETGLTAAQ